jgi:hypothetical protein
MTTVTIQIGAVLVCAAIVLLALGYATRNRDE